MNPYEEWLGIYSDQTPPTYFELLGISNDESDHEIITESAKLQLRKLKKHQGENDATLCKQLVKQIKLAHRTLTDDEARSEYEIQLKQEPALSPLPSKNQLAETPVAPQTSNLPEATYPTEDKLKTQSFLVPIVAFTTGVLLFCGLFVGLSTWLFHHVFPDDHNEASLPPKPAEVATEVKTEPLLKTPIQLSVETPEEPPAKPPETPIQETPEEELAATPAVEDDQSPQAPINAAKPLTWEETLEKVAADLQQIPKRDRQFVRYFSLNNLVSQVSNEELKTTKMVLSKLINSLSWNAKIATLKTIDDQESLCRIDLRHLNWEPNKWEAILVDYPYGVIDETADGSTIRSSTFCECSIVRADWFIIAASRPPLYHELLEIPLQISDLEKRLQVDVASNIRNGIVRRVGITESAVAGGNRLIEKHDSPFGAYWKTYDFASSNDEDSGNSNLLETPLGPGGLGGFQHHSQQIIFTLPNGLLGFAQTNAGGRRINQSDPKIVSDPKTHDHAAITGASCFDCHGHGAIPATDQVRPHFLAKKGHQAWNAIDTTYVDLEEDIFSSEILAHENVIVEHDFIAQSNQVNPMDVIFDQYDQTVTLSEAALELGVPISKISNSLSTIRFDAKTGELEILARNSKMNRLEFSMNYQRLAETLGLGQPTQASLSNMSKKRRALTILAHERSQVPNFDRRHTQAMDLIRIAKQLRSDGNLKDAKVNFESAYEIAPSKNLRAQILLSLAKIHKKQKDYDGLARAFSRLLLDTEAKPEVKKVHNWFYKAAFEVIIATQKSDSRTRQACKRALKNYDFGEYIDFRAFELPEALNLAIEAVFTKQAEQTPEKLGPLLVLKTYYRYFNPNRDASKNITKKLAFVYQNSVIVNWEVAKMFELIGNFEKAAQIQEQLYQNKDKRTLWEYYSEGMNWLKAKRKTKAIPLLEKAEALCFEETPPNSLLTGVAKAWMQLEEYERVVKTCTRLLKLESPAQHWIAKTYLKQALEKLGHTKDEIANQPLLDPKQEFRNTAKRYDTWEESYLPMRASNYISAAENWQKGDRPKKALASAIAAWDLLQELTKDPNKSLNYSQLADVFLTLEQKQRAYDAYVIALNHSRHTSSTVRLQKAVAELGQDPAIRESNDSKEILDPNYQYRLAAKRTEEKKTSSEVARAQNLLDAAGYWATAGDSSSFLRCTKEATEIFDRVSVPSTSKKTSEEQGRLYHSVLKLTGTIKSAEGKLDSEAIDYANTIFIHLASGAKRKLAALDEDTKRLVDPTLKLQNSARRLEEAAERSLKQKQLTRALYEYRRAAQLWDRIGNAKKLRNLTLKSRDIVDQLDKTHKVFRTEVKYLAKTLLKIGEHKLARKYYVIALEVEIDSSRKEEYKDQIKSIDKVLTP